MKNRYDFEWKDNVSKGQCPHSVEIDKIVLD